MSLLVHDLLTLARAEAGPGTPNKESIDLSDLTLEVAERLAPLARTQGLILATGDLPELSIVGDPLFLRQMLTNLVENAIKYTSGVGTRVHVETGCQQKERQQWAWVRVVDDGPGISPAHLPHLFDRFYRGGLARADHQKDEVHHPQADNLPSGNGLGLSIAQWVAQAHGGEVCVQSEARRGSVFMIQLLL
jgi:signal transduction histidine kinase